MRMNDFTFFYGKDMYPPELVKYVAKLAKYICDKGGEDVELGITTGTSYHDTQMSSEAMYRLTKDFCDVEKIAASHEDIEDMGISAFFDEKIHLFNFGVSGVYVQIENDSEKEAKALFDEYVKILS